VSVVGVVQYLSGGKGKRESLDFCLGTAALLKADGVPDFLPQDDVHLVCHSAGNRHGCDSPGLCACHHLAGGGVVCLSHELADLGGFPTPGLPHQDGSLVCMQHLDKIVPGLPHGQPCTGSHRLRHPRYEERTVLSLRVYDILTGLDPDGVFWHPVTLWRRDVDQEITSDTARRWSCVVPFRLERMS